MTDLIHRSVLEYEEGPAPRPRRSDAEPGRPAHALVAVLAACDAALLLYVSAAHLAGWWATLGGAGAVILAALGSASFAWPARGTMIATALAALAGGAFWLATPRNRVDTTAIVAGAVLSASAAVVAAGLARRPGRAGSWSSSTTVFASIVPVGVLVLTLIALLGTDGSSSSRAEKVTTTPAPSTSAGGAAAALALSTTVTVPGESSSTFQSVIAGNGTEQSELAKWQPLDPSTQAVLSHQLAQAYQAAMRFPTVADAKKAGMILAGGMAPGVGAHYQMISAEAMKGVNADGTVNALDPASWIYASTADDAPVVGVMYVSFGLSAPAGFAGPNDHWHQHSNVCVQFQKGKINVPFAADQNVTPQECTDVHGVFMKKTVWMVHAWVVPGWESPQGVFSHDNLHVYCPGNTYLTDALGFCLRQS